MVQQVRHVSLLDACKDVSGGNLKTQQAEYLEEGQFPIVDQGKELIGGYTNNLSAKFMGDLPVIIFGDHTRVIKYVDFQFGMGADGIKVLCPLKGVFPKYLFHYLRSANIPSTGYNRHFKYLKTLIVPLPPLEEQKRIADILDKADALRQKRKQAIAKLDELIQSVFLDMFGDPVTNPKGWDIANLEDLVNFRTGKLDSNASEENGEYPFFTCAREDFRINTYAFDCEALLLAGNNATADYSVKYYTGKFNAYQRTYVITIKNTKRLTYRYVQKVLEYKLQEMKRISKGTNTRYLTLALLNKIQVQVPKYEIMEKFDVAVGSIFSKKNHFDLSDKELNTLFNSLQQQAFKGEL